MYKLCKVASCWKYIWIYLRCTDPWKLNLLSSLSQSSPLTCPPSVLGTHSHGLSIRPIFPPPVARISQIFPYLSQVTHRFLFRNHFSTNAIQFIVYSNKYPTRCNVTQFIYFWKTALHVSGGISTHRQEHIQLYLQHLALVNSYCYMLLLWKML